MSGAGEGERWVEEGGHHLIPRSRLGPHFWVSPRQNLAYPPEVPAFLSNVAGLLRDSGGAITSGQSQPPSLEGAELGATLQLGQFKGPCQRKPEESGARRRGGGAQATTAPRGRAGSRGKPILAPARVGTWNPRPASSRARTGYSSGDPGDPGKGRGPVRTSSESPTAAAHCSAPAWRRPRLRPSEWPCKFKGPAAPPRAPGSAAPPAGTWSPHCPDPGARPSPGTTTPEVPRRVPVQRGPGHEGRSVGFEWLL